VAFGRNGAFDRADLADGVTALAAAVEKVGRGRWLVYSESSYAGAVAVLALLHSGCTAVLAPNGQAQTLRQLGATARGAILDPAAPLDGIARLAPLEQPPAHAPVQTPDAAGPGCVEFRTSGTTGDRKGTLKTLRQLDGEIAVLEATFGGALPPAARIFATMSHQHIYGLLARVLWPLATGRPFSTDNPLHPQELLPRMAESGACALASTPVHLRRLAAAAGLRGLRGTCRAVVSSGAPLDAETAARVAEQLGEAPYEMLGSTETGAVAVRRRSLHGEAWSPLPGVEVACEADSGRLVVTSALASEGEDLGRGRRRFRMGDRVELRSDGSFLLLGRADRIVKIGGKRLSLPDMERQLEAHAWVTEAALIALERASELRVHAVVVASETGRAALAEMGRRALGAGLADHLSGHFDRVLLPRLWRVVDALPRDAQGKLPAESLRALFELGEREPVLLRQTRDARSLERRLEVSEDLAFLDGHFEGNPVVAGVVLVRWVLRAAAELLGEPVRVRTLEALKFPSTMQPPQRFTLRVELSEDRGRLRFHVGEGERVFATGRCALAPPQRSPR
jgi:acyl-coenzyme A synthetase/AMP-(fatty) acid ligase/3-hydroxymyristoyl/3-hydroxydecanoyl-(acyl carrier protein) dehydratase